MHRGLPCGQDFAFSLVELHEVPISPYLQPVNVPLEDSTTLWCISHYFLICVKLAEGMLCPIIQIINEDFKQDWTLYWPLGYTASHWQLDFMPLITTLSAWLFYQFAIHFTAYLHCPYFPSFSVRILCPIVLKYPLLSPRLPAFYPLFNLSYHMGRALKVLLHFLLEVQPKNVFHCYCLIISKTNEYLTNWN